MEQQDCRERFLTECQNEFQQYYADLKRNKYIIFGSGSYGRMMYQALSDAGLCETLIGFCDNDPKKWGKELCGTKIYNLDELRKDVPEFTAVIASDYREEICAGLNEKSVNVWEHSDTIEFVERMLSYYIYHTGEPIPYLDIMKWSDAYPEACADGFERKVAEALKLLGDSESRRIIETKLSVLRSLNLEDMKKLISFRCGEYFDPVFYQTGNDEIFVDCGAFDGDTVAGFLQYIKGEYQKIYAFEPDIGNFEKLTSLVQQEEIANIELFPYATGNENGSISFVNNNTLGAHIVMEEEQEQRIEVPIRKLDDVINGPVSWIKMDIEGAELDTLMGAEKLIRTYKPKIAVCIYHKMADLYEIPLYLHQLVPEYRMIVRHSENAFAGTVLYASI